MAGDRAKTQIKKALRSLGFELQRFDPEGSFAKRRQRLLETERIDVILDVGAHAGEYGQALRHGGYTGRIVSFEPLADLHRRLLTVAERDPRWTCMEYAAGERAGEAEIHISGNDGFSSSLLPMSTLHQEADPSSSYVGSETVKIVTLDEVIDDLIEPTERAMLKIDAQGYERQVLAGAESTLRRCQIVELELGLVELYEGQALFTDLFNRMSTYDFVLTDVERGFHDKQTSQLLQIDGLFSR